MFSRIKSLLFPSANTDTDGEEAIATDCLPSATKAATPTRSIHYSVEMVQTRRQSHAVGGDGEKSGATTTATTMNVTAQSGAAPTPRKRGVSGVKDSPASASRKRRRVDVARALRQERIGPSPEAEENGEMGDTIAILPDLPVRQRDMEVGESRDVNMQEAAPTSQALEAEVQPTKKLEPIQESEPTTQVTPVNGTHEPPTLQKSEQAVQTWQTNGVPKSKHIRFGSEEPEPIEPEPAGDAQPEIQVRPADQESEDGDSEDEAPEAVTLLSGQDQAKAREAEAAKAVEIQKEAARQKRKERDVRLKEQAAASKRSKERKREEVEEDPEDDEDSSADEEVVTNGAPQPERTSRSIARPRLPALLPQEILLTEPTVRPPTPPPQRKGQKQPLKKHTVFRTEKHPKDVKKGPVTVHVVERENKLLPPRAVKTSSAIKEGWLAGRGVVPRKKTGGGFLRR